MVPLEVFVRFIQPFLPDVIVRWILRIYLGYTLQTLRNLDHPFKGKNYRFTHMDWLLVLSKYIDWETTFIVHILSFTELRTVKRIRDAGLNAVKEHDDSSNGKMKTGLFAKVMPKSEP